jgi:DNA-binding winged helix-turn-helix (wHTH) protein/tetratricopeptide (TPR) repeat protein
MEYGHEFQYWFGPFCLNPTRGVLLRDGERVPLTAKSLATLVALVERAGETVPKSELLDAVWEHTAVEENSLNQCISAIRKALGERRGQHEYVVTITGVGYRFVAPVSKAQVAKVDEPTPKELAEPEPEAVPPVVVQPPRAKTWDHLRKVAAIAALLLVTATVYGIYGRVSASSKIGQRRSAVILRLKNLSGTPETAWLSTAIAEMLYHELGAPGSGALRLTPPEDAVRMERDLPPRRSASETLRDIRGYTGVDYALGGTVTVLSSEPGTPVRVDLYVQDLRNGDVVARASAEGSEGQTFNVVRSLAEQLRPALGAGAALASRPSPAPSSARAMQFYSSGIAALRNWDFIQAKDLLLEAVKADPANALCYSALSAAWSDLGYASNAVETAKRAFDLSSSLDELDRLAIEGRYRLATHDWARAAEIYASIWNLVPESIPDATALLTAYWESGKVEEAKRVIARLRALPALQDDPQVDLMEAQTLGATFSDFRRIADLAAHAAAKAKRRQMRDVYARARLIQSSALYSAGDGKAAAPAAEEARKLCEELHDWMCVAHSLRVDGNRYLVSGRIEEAQASYDQALAASRQSGNLAEETNELNGLGILHQQTGDLDAADRDFREALRILQEIRTNTALTRNNYAGVLICAGRLGEAREQATLALAEARASHQIESEAFALTALAQLDQIGGDPRNAVVLGKKAVALAVQSGRAVAEFETGLTLASALAATGETGAAQSALHTAVVDYQPADEDMAFALARAKLFHEASDYAQAVRQARTAADRAKAAHAAWYEVEADSVMALALLRLGRAEEARAVAAHAIAIPQTGARTFSKLDARFAELAASAGGLNLDSLMELAAEARKAGYIELDFEIRLAQAEQAASSGKRDQALHLASELRSEAARRGYGSVAARAARVAANRS